MCLEALSRRKFLQLLGSGAIAATIDAYANPVERVTAYADPLLGQNASGVIINYFLAGGPSRISVQEYNDLFRQKYPTLHFDPEDSIPLNSEFGLHPSLPYFKELYDAGEMSVLLETGYGGRINRSHDGSTRIMNLGAQDGITGWGSRLVATEARNPFGGFCFRANDWSRGGNVGIGGDFGSKFRENRYSYGTFQEQFETLRNQMVSAEFAEKERKFAKGNKNAQYVLESMYKGVENAEYLLSTLDTDLPDIDVDFPNNSVGRQCRETAALILSAIPVKAFQMVQGGFDTHTNAGPRNANLFRQMNEGLEPLIKTLKAANKWQNTTIFIFGEFGRTFENGAAGDDHGHAQPMFVLSGAGLRQGIFGESLVSTARRRYVEYKNFDFRQAILEAAIKHGFSTDNLFSGLNSNRIGLYS